MPKPKKNKSLVPPPVVQVPHVPGAIYVGLDQSLTGTGLVILDDQAKLLSVNLFKTEPGLTPMDEIKRFIDLFQRVHAEIGQIAAGRPVCVIMEDFAFSQPHQMAALGGLGWHFRIMMSRTNWHFCACGTGTLKKVATGKGSGEKAMVILGIYKRWTFEASDNNIADAYVLARISLTAYAKPVPGTLGVNRGDLEAVTKLTIYR